MEKFKADNSRHANQSAACNIALNDQQLQVNQLKSENEISTTLLSACKNQLEEKITIIKNLQRENTAFINEKHTIEGKFNNQKIEIDRVQSAKEAAESQLSYCNRQLSTTRSEIYSLKSQLSSKTSQVYRLESETGQLENLKNHYNLLLKSGFYLPWQRFSFF